MLAIIFDTAAAILCRQATRIDNYQVWWHSQAVLHAVWLIAAGCAAGPEKNAHVGWGGFLQEAKKRAAVFTLALWLTEVTMLSGDKRWSCCRNTLGGTPSRAHLVKPETAAPAPSPSQAAPKAMKQLFKEELQNKGQGPEAYLSTREKAELLQTVQVG